MQPAVWLTMYNVLGFSAASFSFVPLIVLIVSYLCVIFIVAWNLQTMWKPYSDTLRWSLLGWCTLHVLLAVIFLLRHFQVLSIELTGLVGAVVCAVVLVVTSSCSCYVITHNSEKWYEQLMLMCDVFWILFHDAHEQWLAHDGFLLVVPFATMAILRIVDRVERPQPWSCKTTTLELFGWSVLIALDVTYAVNVLHAKPFYGAVCIVAAAMLAAYTWWQTFVFVVFSPFLLPVVVCYAAVVMCRHGVEPGFKIMRSHFKDVVHDVTGPPVERTYESDEDWTSTI